MRHRFALALIATIGVISLGAAFAQESPVPTQAPEPAAKQDPFLRALGIGDGAAAGAVAVAAAQSAPATPAAAPAPAAPLAPPAPPAGFAPIGGVFAQAGGGAGARAGDPAAAPVPFGGLVVTSPDGVYDLGAQRGAYQYILGAQGGGGQITTADPAVLGALYGFAGGQYGAAGGQVQLRVTLEEGNLTVWMGPHAVSPELVERDGATVRVSDAEGRVLATFDVAEDGRVTIPAGWSFSGPPQYAAERPSRRVIGIRTGVVEPALARHLGLGDGEGVLVTEVIEGHPAALAGLQPHDVIVAIDGARPATLESLKDALAEKGEGDSISLTVVRAGHTMEIQCGVSSVSAPVGANELPGGTYALGLGGSRAGAPSGMSLHGELAAEGPSPPIVSQSVPLLLHRRALATAGGGTTLAPAEGTTLSFGGTERSPVALQEWDLTLQRRSGNLAPEAVATFDLAAPTALSPTDGNAERLGAIEERLDRLEKLLEQLVEQGARSPAPRERH